MLHNLFGRFEDWGIALRNRAQTDPFFITRMQLMLLYFAVGAITFMFLGWFVSSLRFGSVLALTPFNEPGSVAQLAYAAYKRELFWRRIVLVGIFLTSTYFVTEFALRSIRKSVELQQRFFGIVSHELRTPLTLMKNSAEVALRNPSMSEDKARQVVESMLEETDRMSHTISFLLSLSSLSIQKNIPDVQVFSLSSIAEQVIEMLQPQADVKGINLNSSITSEGKIRGNPVAIYGLISNLLTNALRYTPHGGEVRVTVESKKRAISLSVCDSGQGIDPQELPYIFEPFYRGTQKESSTQTGFGLGLSLVKEVARLHKARIYIKSKEGGGTTFTFLFPGV